MPAARRRVSEIRRNRISYQTARFFRDERASSGSPSPIGTIPTNLRWQIKEGYCGSFTTSLERLREANHHSGIPIMVCLVLVAIAIATLASRRHGYYLLLS